MSAPATRRPRDLIVFALWLGLGYGLLEAAILQGLVETDLSARDLVEQGYAPEVVRKVSNLLDVAEYKRRQAPPGVKITRKAFGRDRRYPITNAFRKVGLSGQGRDGQPPDQAPLRAAGQRRPDPAD